MKAIRNRAIFASFVVTTLLLLSVSTALAGGQNATGQNVGRFHGRVEVIFTKWVTNFPNMAGLVSGDAGAGHFAGEILNKVDTADTTNIEALYHINGGAFQFTAHNFITQNNLKGTAVIHGVVVDGPMKGARVSGEYQVIGPCGIINALNGQGGDFCFQGTLTIRGDD
jgi:hypothetical protein